MISFIKLVQDHKEMVSYFHSRISARGLGLICDHIKKEDTQGSNYLLDETERTEKLAALNTEVMKIISADFATVVSRRGVVDKYFASVSEYPHDLPIAVFPEPFLPASIKASNKFRVLSCLVIYSLYLMLQWRLHTRTKLDKPLIFVKKKCCLTTLVLNAYYYYYHRTNSRITSQQNVLEAALQATPMYKYI